MRTVAFWAIKIIELPFLLVVILLEHLAEWTSA
jgi:hypothetical protein